MIKLIVLKVFFLLYTLTILWMKITAISPCKESSPCSFREKDHELDMTAIQNHDEPISYKIDSPESINFFI